jgi:hypothetical protein
MLGLHGAGSVAAHVLPGHSAAAAALHVKERMHVLQDAAVHDSNSWAACFEMHQPGRGRWCASCSCAVPI